MESAAAAAPMASCSTARWQSPAALRRKTLRARASLRATSAPSSLSADGAAMAAAAAACRRPTQRLGSAAVSASCSMTAPAASPPTHSRTLPTRLPRCGGDVRGALAVVCGVCLRGGQLDAEARVESRGQLGELAPRWIQYATIRTRSAPQKRRLRDHTAAARPIRVRTHYLFAIRSLPAAVYRMDCTVCRASCVSARVDCCAPHLDFSRQ
mmetsp:Transcript_33272/g.75197  ORF Transcript_33272/g.75197 Transcript_33272/m.75197 type:complete len:211 (-) Transcript_33272:118-750(-)